MLIDYGSLAFFYKLNELLFLGLIRIYNRLKLYLIFLNFSIFRLFENKYLRFFSLLNYSGDHFFQKRYSFYINSNT
nr:MAG TPA: hypothetical protein [Caudoviricetes sp.]